MDLILATSDGREEGLIPYDADIEVGVENSFEIGIPRAAWDETYEYGKRIYVPGTEYGGIIGEIETEEDPEYVFARGRTWRGMLRMRVIEPPEGEAYYRVSGELNSIIRKIIGDIFSDDLFAGADTDTGVSTSYDFRYQTVEEGLTKILAQVGYKIVIRYEQTQPAGRAVVAAEPIENYSARIEFSEDSEVKLTADDIRNGVNHLICLGQGELEERTVIHLYADQYGNITDKQVLFGNDEITEIFDNTAAETEEELRQTGLERLQQVVGGKILHATVQNLEEELDIGDIISGRDYTTGTYVEEPITSKIYRVISEIESTEYGLADPDRGSFYGPAEGGSGQITMQMIPISDEELDEICI